METETFQIKTTGFEGPFGLLLGLVEKRKLFINDVSLATVTEEYLQYLNKLQSDPTLSASRHAEEISSFILVASTLILIKSKSLLPNLDLTDEEQGDIKNLEDRLRQYELYTRLGINIKNNFGRQIIFAPLDRKNDVLVFLPDERITRESMMTLARGVLGAMPKKIFLPEVEVRKVISIEEMIDKLTERIQKSLSTNFRDFANHKSGKPVTREEKIEVIVGFLAMLEMVRNGIVDAVQMMDTGDIIIEKQTTL
ncbi:MAG: segregation/condensation protein A [Candidatus Pacebacteria bacterium]|nr:segregation/condensation protein A [Candidatus Paceibacterota bacterium]